MKTLLVACMLAFVSALTIASLYEPKPLPAQLVRLQVERILPDMANELAAESIELQALFLSFADDPILITKAKLALLRYPEMARPIFLTFGESREFTEVLRRYGEDVMLPIHYFSAHDIFTLELMRDIGNTVKAASSAFRRVWNGSEPTPTAAKGAPSSEERAWYAIQFIQEEGYDLIGQFVLVPDGTVAWIQTERVLEGINSLFASGARALETKIRQDSVVDAGDVGWAALDVAIGVSALKILRLGKMTAVGGRSLTFSQRSAAVGAGLWRGSAIGIRLTKYGAPAVLAYIAIRHPSVINSLLGSIAKTVGVPVGLTQIVGWTLILLPVFLLLRLILRPLAWLLVGFTNVLRGIDRLLRRRKPVQATAAQANLRHHY